MKGYGISVTFYNDVNSVFEGNMKIIKRKIMSADSISTEDDLRSAIENLLNDDLCVEIVNLAFSRDISFGDVVFIPSEAFFDTLIDTEPKDVAKIFYDGRDLDSHRRSADPDKAYFRLDKSGNAESTDNPGEIYYDTILDDIIEYIMDNLVDVEYPEEIQEIIDQYLTVVEE